MNKNLKIAITGGIGSGKSLAGYFFESQGYPVIRADVLAKELMQSDPSVREKIVKEFGKDSFTENSLNSDYLRKNIFHSKENLERINAIVHPVTIKKIEQLSKIFFKDHKIVFIESALVYEAKLSKAFDYVLLIKSEEKIRFDRVIARDDVNEENVKRIMANQISDDKKKKLADFVIENNGTVSDLESKCRFILSVLQSL